MAGARFVFSSNAAEVSETLARLAEKLPETAFKDAGEYLLLAHFERFQRMESPDGRAWEPLTERYKNSPRKRTSRGSKDILRLDGYLRDLLRYQTSESGLEFGTDAVYGATHQFGDDSRNIPARPYLGLSAEDEEEILHIFQQYFDEIFGGDSGE